MNDKEQNQEYFRQYLHKVRIHFTEFSIIMLLILGFFFILYYEVSKKVVIAIIKIFGQSYSSLGGSVNILIPIIVIAFLLMIWISKYSATIPKIKYGKYKIKHPHMNREDLHLLTQVNIVRG